jgi:hypothetical protein
MHGAKMLDLLSVQSSIQKEIRHRLRFQPKDTFRGFILTFVAFSKEVQKSASWFVITSDPWEFFYGQISYDRAERSGNVSVYETHGKKSLAVTGLAGDRVIH